MSGLVDRITAVLREHERYGSRCECGTDVRFSTPQKHAAHVAEQIAEALQLTEEHGYQIDGEHADEPDAWFPAADYKSSRPVSHRRWVSEWAAVQDRP